MQLGYLQLAYYALRAFCYTPLPDANAVVLRLRGRGGRLARAWPEIARALFRCTILVQLASAPGSRGFRGELRGCGSVGRDGAKAARAGGGRGSLASL